MRKILILLPSVVLLSITVYFGISNSNYRNENAQLELDIDSVAGLTAFFKTMFLHQLSAQNSYFDTSVIFHNGLDNTPLNIRQIVKGPMLFLYTGDNYCSDCVKSHMDKFVRSQSLVQSGNMVMLLNNVTSRELYLLRIDNPDFKFHTLTTEDLKIPLKELGTPYLFILDSDMKMQDIFILNKTDTLYNNMYYKIIFNKYFKNLQSS